jgi:hypothetical protein
LLLPCPPFCQPSSSSRLPPPPDEDAILIGNVAGIIRICTAATTDAVLLAANSTAAFRGRCHRCRVGGPVGGVDVNNDAIVADAPEASPLPPLGAMDPTAMAMTKTLNGDGDGDDCNGDSGNGGNGNGNGNGDGDGDGDGNGNGNGNGDGNGDGDCNGNCNGNGNGDGGGGVQRMRWR